MKRTRPFPTTMLTLFAVIVIVSCVWGLRSLYFDLPPLKMGDVPTAEGSDDPTLKDLTLPKLFIYTSELKNEEPTTTNADSAANRKVTDNDLILKVIMQNKHRLQRCYENHLRNQPESRGEIYLALHMTPFGKVQTVRVEKSDFESDPLFASCLESVIKRLRFKFEKADKNFIVSIPLEFQ